MANRPDVRVRLSAEGIAEVVAALRQVQHEANQANRSTASGINSATGALRQFRGALGALGITTTVAGLVGLGRAAFNTAQEISNTAEQLDLTVEEFSRLVYVADQADIQLSEFSKGIVFYQKRISEAISGNREAANSFAQLGLSAKELQKLSLSDQL